MIGIDYGSKLAGTTVIAHDAQGVIRLFGSRKKQDADRFLLDWLQQMEGEDIYIDAPLSLPQVYRYPERGGDFFYRQADREVSAMSPMFLGGLTARAMRLHRQLTARGHAVWEVYPARLAAELDLKALSYKKSLNHLPEVLWALQDQLPRPVEREAVTSWHHIDALLAWLSGWRRRRGASLQFGDPDEGVILV